MRAETVQIRINNLLDEIEQHMKHCAMCGDSERTHVLCETGSDLTRLLESAQYIKGRIEEENSSQRH